MWLRAQIITTVVAAIIVWIFFTCLIRYRGGQTWGAAAGKAFLLALQTGLGLGMLLFCCLDFPDSPTHKNFSLSKPHAA